MTAAGRPPRVPGPLGAAQGDLDEVFELFGDWAEAGIVASAAVFAVAPPEGAGQGARVLMQLRDDLPGLAAAGRWAPFGGGVEAGETLRMAAVREFEEETGLVLDPAGLRPFSRQLSPRPGKPRLYAYLAAMPGPLSAIRLGEGAGFALFTPAQLRALPTAPVLEAAAQRLAELIETGRLA